MSQRREFPTGSTRVAAVIGSPVRHSLSPVIMNAAFEATGLDWVYGAFEVNSGGGVHAIQAMRNLGIGGLSVTMPLKAEIAAAVDECSPDAAVLDAVNCVAWRGNALIGHNTDGAGFVGALRVDEGWDPQGRSCVVIGAGGAARAVIVALAQAGASSVVVVNRSAQRAEHAAGLAGASGRVGSTDDIADADLIVNATPIGMDDTAVTILRPDDRRSDVAATLPFDPGVVGSGQLVVDLIYAPLVTPLVQASQEQGATAVNGLGMLIHQAAHAFRLWTGEDPPLAAMSAAVLAVLRARAT